MTKTRLIAACWLLLMELCVTAAVGQQSVRYPQDARDVMALAETFGRVEFSVKDAIKKFGTVKRDDRFYGKDGSFQLTPFPSNQTLVKRVVLEVFEGKPDRVDIEYLKPVLILYGTLKQKYGAPKYLRPPVIKCRPGVDCRPRFVGYSFGPDPKNLTSDRRLEVFIDLTMKWSKEVPQHLDKDFLAVEAIRVRRVWRDQ